MIIGLSGRKNTGKTTLSNILIDKGFKRASFATSLKEYTAELFDWNLEKLYSQSGKEELLENPVTWNKKTCSKLENLAGLTLKFSGEVEFRRRREALQYIGTDVLRAADPEFHVNKFAEKFMDGDFVLDDVRFLNEVNTLKRINGICVHVVRPYNWDYSNHDSEISVLRNHVENVILNDKSQEELIEKFDKFYNSVSEISSQNVDVLLNRTKETAYWAGVIGSCGIFKEFSDKYVLELKINNKNLLDGLKDFLKINDNFISCPFMIDDLKLWDVVPSKKEFNSMWIKTDKELLDSWNKGFNECI